MADVETILTNSEEETSAAGERLAVRLKPGDVLLLHGDLGAGKTAFVRGLARGLGAPPDDVSSPTFTIVQEYRGGRLPMYHVDLYRLNDAREIDDLGLEEITADGVLAIEWAEKMPRPVRGAIVVRLTHVADDVRNLTIQLPDYPITPSPNSGFHSDR